jgi:NADH dehydrogenase
LIEAGPRLLACFPLSQSDYVREALTRAGVEVKLNTKVTGCDARGVDTDAGRIDAATIIWAAGIVASPAARWLNVEADHVGRVKVNANLSVPGRPDIYVIGDTVTIIDAAGRQPPGTAPAAKQMGHYVAKLIADRIADPNKPTKPFRYKDVGELATIGRRAAILKLRAFELRGFLGWLFWCVVHIYFLIGLRNRFIVAFIWLWSYVTFQRGARLITGPERDDGKSE